MIIFLLPMLIPTAVLVAGGVINNSILLWVAVGLQVLMSFGVKQKAGDSSGSEGDKAKNALMLVALMMSSLAFGIAGIVILAMRGMF
jgi:hypothetical protein